MSVQPQRRPKDVTPDLTMSDTDGVLVDSAADGTRLILAPAVRTYMQAPLGALALVDAATIAQVTGLQAALDSKADDADLSAYATSAALNANATADRARANHTGTQLAATISDFGAAVMASQATCFLVVTTRVPTTAPGDTTLYTVPTGKIFTPTMFLVRAPAFTTVSSAEFRASSGSGYTAPYSILVFDPTFALPATIANLIILTAGQSAFLRIITIGGGGAFVDVDTVGVLTTA